MLVFIILLFSVSVRARIETGDGGTINLSEILKRIDDLEDRLQIQARINEEQNAIVRRLQPEKGNGNHLPVDEKKTSMDTKKDDENQWIKVDIENKTHPIDDIQGPNMERALRNSNNVPRSIKHSETFSKGVWNRIQRKALAGGVAFYSFMSHPEPSPGKHQTIIFDNEVTNVGGNYNHHAGIFISPENGVYTFSWSIHCHSSSGSGIGISTQLVINSNPVGASYCSGMAGQYAHTSGNVVVEISQGDVVYLRTDPDGSIAGQISSYHDFRSTFSGWKLF